MNLKENIVKILTLGIGLAIGLVLVAKVCFELSYDKFYDRAEDIYCIRTMYIQQGEEKDYSQVSGAVAPGFKQFISSVESATRTTFIFDSDKYLDAEGNIIQGKLVLADTSFFDVFPIEIIEGDAKATLNKVCCAMVSRSFAEKMGGEQECIGKTICNEGQKGLKITIEGVYEDFPKNGTLDYDILLSMESYSPMSTNNWVGNDRYKGYVKLAKGTDPNSLSESIHKMQKAYQPMEEFEKAGIKLWYYLAPFDKLHTSEKSVRNSIVLLGIVAFLLLLVSIFNYILLVISSIVKRSKEIGVRKCYGAESKHIYGILAKETAVNLVLSLVLAGLILLALRGSIKNLLGVALADLFIPQTIWALIAVVLLVFAIAVVIPANIYNKIPISQALRNYSDNSRRWKLALLLVQFFITAFMVIMVLIVSRQYSKAVNGNIGYETRNILTFPLYSWNDVSNSQNIEDALRALPEVADVQFSYNIPYEGSNGDNVYLPNSSEVLFNVADQYNASEGWLNLMGIKMLEGTAPSRYSDVAVSRSFVERIGNFTSMADGAIGKSFAITGHGEELEIEGTEVQADANGFAIFTICGVYEDYLIGSLNEADERPSVLFYGKAGEAYMPNVFVKVNDPSRETTAKVKSAAESITEDKNLNISYISDTVRSLYDDTRKIRNTILIGSIFSLLIALFGLIGYIRNEAGRRSKEMAIRKINGADTHEITGLFVWDILKIALVAVVLADIAAFFAARKFLTMFSQKIALSPLIFIIADIIVLLIIVASVVLNSLRIAGANPVDSLKSE